MYYLFYFMPIEPCSVTNEQTFCQVIVVVCITVNHPQVIDPSFLPWLLLLRPSCQIWSFQQYQYTVFQKKVRKRTKKTKTIKSLILIIFRHLRLVTVSHLAHKAS